MNTDKNRFRLLFSVGLLLAAFLFSGCEHVRLSSAGARPDRVQVTEEMPLLEHRSDVVYGTPGTDVIRVYVSGTEAKRRGLYYFRSGTTLKDALTIEGNPVYTEFARHVRVSNLANDRQKTRSYRIHKVNRSEQAEILHDNDCLYFPCSF